MVLDNATAESDAFVDPSAPEPDADHYASIQGGDPNIFQYQSPPHTVHIPYDQLKAQLPGVFLNRGSYDRESLQRDVGRRIKQATSVLKRPVQQDEAEALAANLMQARYVGSYGEPLAWLIALGLWARRPGRMHFPGGWYPGKAGSRFSPDRFGYFKGRTARIMWQGTALSWHVVAWNIGMAVVFVPYAMTTLAVHDIRDPRLKEYVQGLQKQQQEQKEARDKAKQGTTTQTETFEQRRQRERIQRAAKTAPHDDASPTGGMFASDYGKTESQSDFVADDFLGSRQGQTQTRTQRAQDVPSPRQVVQQAPQGSTRSMVDDLTAEPQVTPRSGGSAWDRLRQDAMGSRNAKPGEKT